MDFEKMAGKILKTIDENIPIVIGISENGNWIDFPEMQKRMTTDQAKAATVFNYLTIMTFLSQNLQNPFIPDEDKDVLTKALNSVKIEAIDYIRNNYGIEIEMEETPCECAACQKRRANAN